MNTITHRILTTASPRHSVELIGLDKLSPQDFASWDCLAEHALAPNPFAQPDFVVPLVQNLGINDVAVLIVRDQSSRWLYAVPVVQHYFEEGSPLPKLRMLRSPYTFLEQPLVDRNDATITLSCLLDALSQQREWHGLGCAKAVVNSDQFELTEFAARICGVELHRTYQSTRPAVTPQSKEQLLEKCSSSRRKSLRKNWRRLEKRGAVEFRITQPVDGETDEPINTFLHLEALGWKGSEGTALASMPNDREFFRSVCQQFAKKDNLIFGELLVAGRVISSTCNFRSGNTLFAFKIGWDPDFSNCGIGYWSEVLLADAIFQHDSSVTFIDSCSDEESYTGKVWTERLQLSNAILVWSHRAKLVQGAKSVVRTIVNR